MGANTNTPMRPQHHKKYSPDIQLSDCLGGVLRWDVKCRSNCFGLAACKNSKKPLNRTVLFVSLFSDVSSGAGRQDVRCRIRYFETIPPQNSTARLNQPGFSVSPAQSGQMAIKVATNGLKMNAMNNQRGVSPVITDPIGTEQKQSENAQVIAPTPA